MSPRSATGTSSSGLRGPTELTADQSGPRDGSSHPDVVTHDMHSWLLSSFVSGRRRAVFFLFIHLMLGKLIRPSKPETEKLTIYECGEPTVGSAWIQFDLRYYVVALLFVIFDVEVAFFFPWAVVFGNANALANRNGYLSEA